MTLVIATRSNASRIRDALWNELDALRLAAISNRQVHSRFFYLLALPAVRHLHHDSILTPRADDTFRTLPGSPRPEALSASGEETFDKKRELTIVHYRNKSKCKLTNAARSPPVK
ncbi:hypothetical protein CBOM_07539 [Ceraceosorus bombacis]|uniref:Uncharacterized protein n=1 Tax=Ceraceosorus bombacis TaxID=401625 RepID=A0A0P1BFK6_9BASI|nr:hypothetical protein CBOM_07539 [Ceraceosorus bombacis]